MPLKKIGDLPKNTVCRDPEHNPPGMIVLESGLYEHTCPGCGHASTFIVPEQPSLQSARSARSAAKYRLKSLTQTCTACPSQWDGKLTDGTPVYIRYRWGSLRVDLNPFTDEELTIYVRHHGDGLDGSMSEEDMLRAVSGELDSTDYESIPEAE